MALAGLADGVTMLALPPGAEANPIVAALIAVSPVLAFAAKLAAVCLLIAIWERHRGRLRNLVYAVATVTWSFGAIVNVLSLR